MITWNIKPFSGLTTSELYAVLRLRSEVFVVEQNCVYLDPDGKDITAWHVMGWENEKLVAYTRILPPGTSYKEASIGRVVTTPAARKGGVGRMLMERSIAYTRMQYTNSPIRISAQEHLTVFYISLGFKKTSESYLEDGIPHVEMLLEQ